MLAFLADTVDMIWLYCMHNICYSAVFCAAWCSG